MNQRRHLGDLTEAEWDELVSAFSDTILARFGVAGSVAKNYNLYEALEMEYDKALEATARKRARRRR